MARSRSPINPTAILDASLSIASEEGLRRQMAVRVRERMQDLELHTSRVLIDSRAQSAGEV